MRPSGSTACASNSGAYVFELATCFHVPLSYWPNASGVSFHQFAVL